MADNLFYIQMTGGHDCKQDVECYIINKYELERVVLEIFPDHYHLVMGIILFIEFTPFLGGILGACTIIYYCESNCST